MNLVLPIYVPAGGQALGLGAVALSGPVQRRQGRSCTRRGPPWIPERPRAGRPTRTQLGQGFGRL